MRQVVRQNEVPCEGVSKCLVEAEHLHQLVLLDHVQIRVRQGPHVRGGLPGGAVILPELVAEDIAFS